MSHAICSIKLRRSKCLHSELGTEDLTYMCRCPDAKIFMSGYSEGGMVSHNGVAYADDEAKKHVAVGISLGERDQRLTP